MQLCLSGDADAYAVLVERYGGRVYNIALRITRDADAAQDCAQEAFVRAYRALHQYDPGLPFGPWLFRITTNASLNHAQRWQAHETTVEELPDDPAPPEAGPEPTAVRREEVADALGLPLGTVKTHLHRARAALRARLAARARTPGEASGGTPERSR